MPSAVVFDPLVFDFGFDSVDIVPVILKVQVDRQYSKVTIGQSVPITLYIINNSSTPNRRFMFTPPEAPTITIFTPTNVEVVTDDPMPQRGVGVFTYICHTTLLSTLGLYSAVFAVESGTAGMVSKKYGLFTLI